MQARHYYQIIKRPMDLSVIRAKLSKRNTQSYNSPHEFVADVYLMFRNCAKFNYVSRNLRLVFHDCDYCCGHSWLILIIIGHFITPFICISSLFDHSPTLRWPKQAAASKRSSHPSSKRFSQTPCFLRPRRTLTATNTTRPTGLLMAAFPGQRGESNATGRGRGGTL